MSTDLPRGRKLLLASVVSVAFLAVFPQLFFMLTAQGAWNGSYYVSNYDEPAYSAYVNALIEGKPRKNDPFLGLADGPETPQPETLYSIQFIPPYAIALPARLLGVEASTAFLLLAIFIAAASTLAIYKLLMEATGDEMVAAVGPIVILCLGTLVAFQGEIRHLAEGRVLADYLPFLRRYQPGFAFPLFFVFCLFAWKAVTAGSKQKLAALAAAAGVVFAILVFSYFYLWTAAAAWLFCFSVASIFADRNSTKNVAATASIIGVLGAAALVPFFWLLSNRSAELDSVQLLTLTRAPELSSPSMWAGLITASAAVYLFRKQPAEKPALLLSFALTPVILFNQQIVTGRSLQPVHYELFIANYMVLTAAVLLIAAWRGAGETTTPRFQRGLGYLGAAALAWGLFEAYGSTSRGMTVAEIRDASVPAIRAAAADHGRMPVILATNFVTSDIIPTVANARPLWNPHTSSGGGVGVRENKRLFYMYLYFSGFSDRDLEAALRANSFEVTSAVFGAERALPSLGGGSNKVTEDEIRAEAANYAEFARKVDARNAYSPAIDHIIVPAGMEPDLSNLDRWYTRHDAQTFGLFTVYGLEPKAALQ